MKNFEVTVLRSMAGSFYETISRLAEKFDLAQDKVPAYDDSYHGLAVRAGNTTVAHCASCHGADGKAQTKSGRMLKVEDLTDPEVRAKFDRARMIQATKDGVPKEEGSKTLLMPAYSEKLTDEQIGLLIDYIESFGNE